MLREERCDGQKIQDYANNSKLKGLVNKLEAPGCRLILRTKNIGFWLTVRGNKVNSSVLAATEFHDFFCACYDVNPPQP